MIVNTPYTAAAEEEQKRTARANYLMEAGGCWITAYTEDSQKKIKDGCQGELPCENCPAYIEFYKIVNNYQRDGHSSSEAIWLACQFYDIPTQYMCDGGEEEWLKEYNPERYKENIKRQAELMGESPEKPKEKPKVTIGNQLTIEDLFGGL